MKAVLQNFITGKLQLHEVPPPVLQPGGVLVRNVTSLLSAGTDRAVVELARMSLIRKARTRPDLVQRVLNKAGQEGWLSTARIVLGLVSTPVPLGYSSAGVVEAVGSGLGDLACGDRVACTGLGYANHAEVIFVPRNLVARIPPSVDFSAASFVALGAIALHSVRQAEVGIGHAVVVVGLGLVGQLVAQICIAAGAHVFGIDLDQSRVNLARELGMQAGQSYGEGNVVDAVTAFTRREGADAVILAAATASSQPVRDAAAFARDRGRIVAVGDISLNIPRRAYYQKELELRLSRSYGPGRYDPSYEEQGHDYPIGYVRWTENRNMEAFLDLVAAGRVKIPPLITHRYPIDHAEEAYRVLMTDRHGASLGILIDYDSDRVHSSVIRVSLKAASQMPKRRTIGLGIVGAGQFARGVLLPSLRRIRGVEIVGVASASGVTARAVADKYSSQFCTSDYRDLLASTEVDAIIVATRHHLHASIVVEALRAGKDVFVEKPLALSEEQLAELEVTVQDAQDRVLQVGFNRRFSPVAAEIRAAVGGAPMVIGYRVNAGPIPASHWVQDPNVGGGRIVGEVCHFVDLMQFLTQAEPREVMAWPVPAVAAPLAEPDTLSVEIRFSDGSLGTLLYLANGDPGFPKEHLEVFCGGRVGVIDNWRRIEIWTRGRRRSRRLWLQTAKGHIEELQAFVDAVRAREWPIAWRSMMLTTRTTFAIQRSLQEGRPVHVGLSAAMGEATVYANTVGDQ